MLWVPLIFCDCELRPAKKKKKKSNKRYASVLTTSNADDDDDALSKKAPQGHVDKEANVFFEHADRVGGQI